MNIKKDLYARKSLFGTWCILPSPEMVGVLTRSGLDFILIDMEHSPVDFITAQRMAISAKSEGKYAIVRVGKLEETEILRSLDIGTDGIIIPHIETLEEVDKAVSFIKYFPEGNRGYSPYTRAGGYCVRDDYTKTENSRLLLGVIIESRKGIENLDEILNSKDVDLVYLGAYDISISLGFPGQITHPEVMRILDNCIQKIVKSGKIAGAMYHTSEDAKKFEEQGVKFLVYKVDTLIVQEGLDNVRKMKHQ